MIVHLEYLFRRIDKDQPVFRRSLPYINSASYNYIYDGHFHRNSSYIVIDQGSKVKS